MTTGEEKITQKLTSGITIRQHFGDSVRFLMFATDDVTPANSSIWS